jgi:hypothetical protein
MRRAAAERSLAARDDTNRAEIPARSEHGAGLPAARRVTARESCYAIAGCEQTRRRQRARLLPSPSPPLADCRGRSRAPPRRLGQMWRTLRVVVNGTICALMVPYIRRNQLETRGKPPFFAKSAACVRALPVCSAAMTAPSPPDSGLSSDWCCSASVLDSSDKSPLPVPAPPPSLTNQGLSRMIQARPSHDPGAILPVATAGSGPVSRTRDRDNGGQRWPRRGGRQAGKCITRDNRAYRG